MIGERLPTPAHSTSMAAMPGTGSIAAIVVAVLAGVGA